MEISPCDERWQPSTSYCYPKSRFQSAPLRADFSQWVRQRHNPAFTVSTTIAASLPFLSESNVNWALPDLKMQALNLKPSHAHVKAYYEALGQYGKLNFDHEMAVRAAFQHLLEKCATRFH